MRSKLKRKGITVRGRLSAGETTTAPKATLLDYILPRDAQGKPLLEMEHSLSPETILYLSGGVFAAATLAGVFINKFSK
jgi:hypothetical protein